MRWFFFFLFLNSWVRGGGHVSSSGIGWILDLPLSIQWQTFEGATKILKDGTIIFSEFRKKCLFLRDVIAVELAWEIMSLQLSSSGGHVSTPGMALYQRGSSLDVLPLVVEKTDKILGSFASSTGL